jgi:hypothetical protein
LITDIIGSTFQPALNTALDIDLNGQESADDDDNQDRILERTLPFFSSFI